MVLQLYRNGSKTVQVDIDENTVYTHEVIGVHEIKASFITNNLLDIKVDDYIMFRGERYNINVEFPVKKVSNFQYEYEITFEGYVYWLKERILRHLGDIEFSYFGEARAFIQLIVDVMNEEDEGWSVGTVDDTEEKSIDFYGEEKGYTCKGALMLISETFTLEFWLTGKTIHLTKQAGVDTAIDFEYGRGKGLYSITRGGLENPLYNRIYGFGGTTNIPQGYRGGAKRLVFEARKLERPLAPGERRRETSVIFDDIYPHRTGTLTAVSDDWLSLTDTSINFDLKGQRIGSENVKISFTSGDLSGKEYEIDRYNHSTKTMVILPFEEENGYVTPKAERHANVGDTYVLLNLNMPQSYVTDAENELQLATDNIFKQLSRPPYEVEIDEKYVRDNGFIINAGDRVNLKDAALAIDDKIRVTSVSFPLVNPNKITCVISDSITYTSEVQQEIDKNKVKEEVKIVDRTKSELARRNVLGLRRLQSLTFDPDGYFDVDRIKPLSIETYMLSVGAKSQNFGLNGVTINANTGGDPNHLTLSAGSLVHYEVEIEGLGYVWQLQAADFTDLDPLKSYYLAAKCADYELIGEWIISEQPIHTDDIDGYYCFNIGVIYPVSDGYRSFDFTKGMTFIVGDQITTGKIKSLDGLNFFDLSQGKFNLGDEESGIDWDVTTPGALTIRGAIASSTVLVGSGGFVSAGLSGLSEDGDQSIRFWAGASLENVINANFKVLNNGDTYVRKLIMGYGGNSQGWVVSSTGIISDPPTGGADNFALIRGRSLKSQFSFGTELIPSPSSVQFSLIGRIENNNLVAGSLPGEETENIGLGIKAWGADKNIALDIDGGFIRGLAVNTKRVNTGYQILNNDDSIVVTNNSNGDIFLPANPEIGQMHFISHYNSVDITLKSSSANMRVTTNVGSAFNISWGDLWQWDGQYWNRLVASSD